MGYNYLKHYKSPAGKPACRYGVMAVQGRRVAFFAEHPQEVTCKRCLKAMGLPVGK